LYMENCTAALGREIVPGECTAEEEQRACELDKIFTSNEWLKEKSKLRKTRVKIHENVQLVEQCFKAPGGLVRIMARVYDSYIDELMLSGDFTMLPNPALGEIERAMRGSPIARDQILERIDAVYKKYAIQSPGLYPSHIADAIAFALKEREELV
jgi:hypothetical protein